MQDELYFYVMMFGLIVVGLGWLWSRQNNGDAVSPTEQARFFKEWKNDSEQRLKRLELQLENLRLDMQSLRREAEQAATESSERELRLEQRYNEIFELVEEGLSTNEIARKLEMGVGEVELIIQLHAMSTGGKEEKRVDRRSAS